VKVQTLGRGVLLPEPRLALDTSAPGYASVVSHAHGDHIPWDAQEAYATPETADLMAVRAPHIRVMRVPWGERTRVAGGHVTFLPAGHILGSALTLVEAADGSTLLYTGDTKTRRSLTTPLAEFPEADTLIVESTFGLPIYRFPDYAELGDRMASWGRECLAEGETPVFLGYALGKSQEILASLCRRGILVVAHGAVWNMCRVYERHGIPFEGARPYEPGKVQGAALVVPDSFREHPMVLKLDHRIAYCSGWALLSRSRTQLDADALFPLSDHADYEGLRDIVQRVGAQKVYTNHGYADVLAHLLRKEGCDASPLHVGHAEEDAGPAGAQQRLEATG
jgi:Cft2 family RNA processing exonuclease